MVPSTEKWWLAHPGLRDLITETVTDSEELNCMVEVAEEMIGSSLEREEVNASRRKAERLSGYAHQGQSSEDDDREHKYYKCILQEQLYDADRFWAYTRDSLLKSVVEKVPGSPDSEPRIPSGQLCVCKVADEDSSVEGMMVVFDRCLNRVLRDVKEDADCSVFIGNISINPKMLDLSALIHRASLESARLDSSVPEESLLKERIRGYFYENYSMVEEIRGALIRHAETVAYQKGRTKIYLYSVHNLIRLYEELGFSCVRPGGCLMVKNLE